MIEDTVPKAKVRQIAEQFHKLVALKDQQAAVQAELIRWCLMALRQTPEQAERRIENERKKSGKPYRRVGMFEVSRKVLEDRRLAFTHLEWLADKLEGKDVPPSPISSDDLTQSIEGDDDVHRGDSTS